MKIFLNPGHAPGIDSGAVNSAYGVTEAEICRDIGAKVKAYLLAAGCEVRILQSDNLAGESTGPNVCATANAWPADIFVALHCNSAADASASGTECLVFGADSVPARNLAGCIQHQIVRSLGTVDRGLKARPNLIVLKDTDMPATLVEMAFISNFKDVVLLTQHQDDFARAIACGVTDYISEGRG